MQKQSFDYEFEAFSSRKSFNRNLNHFKGVTAVIAEVEAGGNLADAVQNQLVAGTFEPSQILPIVNAVLKEKYQYQTFSYNFKSSNEDLSALAEEIGKWNAVDLVATYFHPEAGVMIINPKNPQHWINVGSLKRFEPITIFAGGFTKTESLLATKPFKAAVSAALDKLPLLLEGQKVKIPAALYEGTFVYKPAKKEKAPKAAPATKAVASKAKKKSAAVESSEPTFTVEVATLATHKVAAAPAAAQPATRQLASAGGRMTVSAKIGVQVTNELFHNGNVEAWKKIIDSYSFKYPLGRVTVYYEGEVIHDINSLFKWGKVKHGTSIYFSVASGEEIKDLSKLRKYLIEGASPRFEAFLHGAPGKVLELF